MTGFRVLVAVLTLGACSGEWRRADDAVKVVEREQGSVTDGPVAALPKPVPRAAVPATPTPPASGLDALPPVRGDFTHRPLPPELAHLGGLGGKPSQAEERTP